MHDMGNAVHDDFEGNRNLLFDLLGRNSRPLGNDLNVVVGDIGIGLNGQALERDDTGGKKDDGQRQHEQAVAQGEIDDAANHLLGHLIAHLYCSTVFCNAKAFETT